jgi:hypothetical protein
MHLIAAGGLFHDLASARARPAAPRRPRQSLAGELGSNALLRPPKLSDLGVSKTQQLFHGKPQLSLRDYRNCYGSLVNNRVAWVARERSLQVVSTDVE